MREEIKQGRSAVDTCKGERVAKRGQPKVEAIFVKINYYLYKSFRKKHRSSSKSTYPR
jgi:hypothetical protein